MSLVLPLLVTGSRDWTGGMLLTVLNHQLAMANDIGGRLVVVHGACPTGADALTDVWAKTVGVPVERYPALWREKGVYNPQAGLLRNRMMVDRIKEIGRGRVAAFIKNGSRGATHCARVAEEAGLPVVRWTE